MFVQHIPETLFHIIEIVNLVLLIGVAFLIGRKLSIPRRHPGREGRTRGLNAAIFAILTVSFVCNALTTATLWMSIAWLIAAALTLVATTVRAAR